MRVGDRVRVKSYIVDLGRKEGVVVVEGVGMPGMWYVLLDDADHGEPELFYESELDVIAPAVTAHRETSPAEHADEWEAHMLALLEAQDKGRVTWRGDRLEIEEVNDDQAQGD